MSTTITQTQLKPFSTVTLTFPDGTVHTFTVNGAGNFQYIVPYENGETIRFQGTKRDDTPIDEYRIIRDIHPPAAPSGAVSPDGVEVTGTAQPGSEVAVRSMDGTLLGTITADSAGQFTIRFTTPQKDGETLRLTARDAGGTSAVTYVNAPDISPPPPPTIAFYDGPDDAIIGDFVRGQAEPLSQVTISDPDGNVLAVTKTDEYGNYETFLSEPRNQGQLVLAVATDMNGNPSLPSSTLAPTLPIPCFLAQTLIATPKGAVEVQDLRPGDEILTATGEVVSVLWLGQRKVTAASLRQKDFPIAIQAGSFGQGLPSQELRVSADHGLFLDGLIINAGALQNGRKIAPVPLEELGPHFTYYHIETEAHHVIRANGLPVETFIDYVSRSAFDNYGDYLKLVGADRILRELPHPRISAKRQVPDKILVLLGSVGEDNEREVAFHLTRFAS